MREKGTDFSIARTRYTVNKQKFLQHPMVKRISALAEDEQRKGCRPGNEGKAPPGPAHLMQKRALIAMQYSALHNRTWKTPTVQKPCRNRAAMAYKTKKSHEIFRFTASMVDIPTRWNSRAKQQQRVALADFSAAPWQGFEKSERGPNNSSLFQPQAAVVVVALG